MVQHGKQCFGCVKHDLWVKACVNEKRKVGEMEADLRCSGPEFEPLSTVELTPGGLTQPVILLRWAK